MFVWLDRIFGIVVAALSGGLVVLFGSSQILVGLILAGALLFRPGFLPAALSTWGNLALM
jgi:hypothetical protein